MGGPKAERPLDASEEAVMRALEPAMKELLRRWDADLSREADLSLIEYSVLRVLSESEDGRRRMSDLAGQCRQSLSGVSRTVGRLEREGLVGRERSTVDARGAEAVLTSSGLRRLQAAWPTHLRSVRRSFFDHLTGLELTALADALDRVAKGIDVPASDAD